MKISIRGGHNPQAQGANGILNEVSEDRKIYASVMKWLRLDKNEVIDVTPYSCVSAEDLKRGVSDANIHNCNIFASIHLNAGGGHGTEVLYHANSTTGKTLATRVSKSMSELGFVNRGAKSDVRGLYELKHTSMPAIVIECFFCDSAADVIIYQKLGVDKLGKAIAEGIVGHTINEVVKDSFTTDARILLIQKVCNKVGIRGANDKPLIEDGINGTNTEVARIKLIDYIANVVKL